jgi:hypothetical protein
MERQQARNREARQRLIDKYGVLTEPQPQLDEWGEQGRIVGVLMDGELAYPTLQFDADGQPHEVFQRVIGVMREHAAGPWEILLWFTTRTGWLGDRAPVDVIGQMADDVIVNAAHEVFNRDTW